MTIAGAFVPQAADFGDYLPVLFVIYVIYAIVSSMAKTVRQAAQAQKAASAATTASAEPQMTAADVRLALQRRVAAAAAARAQAAQQTAQPAPRPVSMPPAPAVVSASTSYAAPDFGAPAMLGTQALADASLVAPKATDLASLLASLPLAAQAVVASSVIGPCAAHRGGGHDPEDW